MSETEEEKKKRWAKNAAMSYMTPAMAHAMRMSKYQSQTKYKEQFNKTKGKGFTAVTSTPEIENAKTQSMRISQNKYKSEFEKNKAKFTQVADNPEQLRLKKVTNQVSKVAYSGKGSAMAERKYPRKRPTNNVPAKTEEKPELIKDEEVIEPQGHEATSYDSGTKETQDDNKYEEEHTENSYPSATDHGSYEATYEEPVRGSYEEPGYTGEEESNLTPEHYGGQEEAMETQVSNEDYSRYDAHETVSADDFLQSNDYSSDAVNHEENYEAPDEYAEVAEKEEFQEVSESGLDDFYANLG